MFVGSSSFFRRGLEKAQSFLQAHIKGWQDKECVGGLDLFCSESRFATPFGSLRSAKKPFGCVPPPHFATVPP